MPRIPVKLKFTTYLFNAPRDERHKLKQVVEAVQGPEVESFDIPPHPEQAVLGTQVVERVLPSGIIVVPLSSQGVVVDDKRGPDARQVDGRVPVATNLMEGGGEMQLECVGQWNLLQLNLPNSHSSVHGHPSRRRSLPGEDLVADAIARTDGLDRECHLLSRHQCNRLLYNEIRNMVY